MSEFRSRIRIVHNSGRNPSRESQVTTGKRCFVDIGDGRSAWAKRWGDLILAHANDLGGLEMLSEAQISLCRRASAIARMSGVRAVTGSSRPGQKSVLAAACPGRGRCVRRVRSKAGRSDRYAGQRGSRRSRHASPGRRQEVLRSYAGPISRTAIANS